MALGTARPRARPPGSVDQVFAPAAGQRRRRRAPPAPRVAVSIADRRAQAGLPPHQLVGTRARSCRRPAARVRRCAGRRVVGHPPGSNSSSSHIRSCISDSGARRWSARRAIGVRGAAALAWPSAQLLAPARATVGPSNSERSDSDAPSSRFRRAVSCAASSEWPPSAKKSSCDADVRQRRAPAPSPSAIARSRSLRGATRLGGAAVAPQVRRRQRLAVDLAVGQQRHRVERDEVLRHHVVGQRLRAGARAARSARRCSPGRRHDVGDQAHVAGPVLARDHHRARDTADGAASCVSISPSSMRIAAHLDLEVEAAEVLEVAVGAPAAAVAGAVQHAPRGHWRTGRRRSARRSAPGGSR